MTTRVAINGLGRIGRSILKLVMDEPSLDLVAVNDLVEPENLAYLLRFDTVYGRYAKPVAIEGGDLVVAGRRLRTLRLRDPSALPWKELDIALVFECTGALTHRQDLEKHVRAGAKTVLLSAPSKEGEIETVVHGVNAPGGTAAIVWPLGRGKFDLMEAWSCWDESHQAAAPRVAGGAILAMTPLGYRIASCLSGRAQSATLRVVKNKHAVALGRLGGPKGAAARARSLPPERRREIARAAAEARWNGRLPELLRPLFWQYRFEDVRLPAAIDEVMLHVLARLTLTTWCTRWVSAFATVRRWGRSAWTWRIASIHLHFTALRAPTRICCRATEPKPISASATSSSPFPSGRHFDMRIVLLIIASAFAACAQNVIDRVAVVVGNQVITESEVILEARLTVFFNREPLDLSAGQRKAAAERLVDQQLIRNEMQIGGYLVPPETEGDEALRKYRQDNYSSVPAFRASLAKYELTEDEVKRHLLWQAAALRFTDQRFHLTISAPPSQSADRLSQGTTTTDGVEDQMDTWLKQARAGTRIQFKKEAFQ